MMRSDLENEPLAKNADDAVIDNRKLVQTEAAETGSVSIYRNRGGAIGFVLF